MKKIGVIMGGISSEREISLLTGQEMIANLDRGKYEVVPIEINTKRDLIDKTAGIDFALLALHGKYGEDGTVQGTLESLGIPYSGCGVLSSSVSMDKELAKKLIRFDDILTADWINVSSMEELASANVERLGLPVVVKPNSGGSSIATRLIKTQEEIAGAVAEALKWDNSVMIEQFVGGDEITCAVLNGKLLPIVSIQANSDFFDYDSKYQDGGATEEIIELPADVHALVEASALGCYKSLKCSVYARIDMIIANGVPYVLEANTLPGLTKNSLLPKAAKAAGIKFSELLDYIIDYSLEERKEN
ncbi:D-alanine--D-alanine ligase [Paenibacillus glycanilyticus]|uniref:D-alanine--D-alanine ligase n=1 Tax=Paenibacillus glycanilyticus TaxID=126569 RepID=A0ABQ6GFF1_9BACL|nr:D-alanine--D-alanine ligase [Paenibacillus glycanilyticus]GLX68800.1 D-alanine--D-alanine ligase [Paenibacillus glycanilyticus]